MASRGLCAPIYSSMSAAHANLLSRQFAPTVAGNLERVYSRGCRPGERIGSARAIRPPTVRAHGKCPVWLTVHDGFLRNTILKRISRPFRATFEALTSPFRTLLYVLKHGEETTQISADKHTFSQDSRLRGTAVVISTPVPRKPYIYHCTGQYGQYALGSACVNIL